MCKICISSALLCSALLCSALLCSALSRNHDHLTQAPSSNDDRWTQAPSRNHDLHDLHRCLCHKGTKTVPIIVANLQYTVKHRLEWMSNEWMKEWMNEWMNEWKERRWDESYIIYVAAPEVCVPAVLYAAVPEVWVPAKLYMLRSQRCGLPPYYMMRSQRCGFRCIRWCSPRGVGPR